VRNREAVAQCELVFIAVPTPTTPQGFDSSILESVLSLVGAGNTAIIKSTVVPGTTKRLQSRFPDIHVLHSPEFLREKQAAADTRHPLRTIIGLPERSAAYEALAKDVIAVLPHAPYELICNAVEAELIKYAGNTFLAMKVVYMNLIYDLAGAVGASYDTVAEAMAADPRIGASHTQVIDSSGHPGAVAGRGAGGHCFPKDLAALRAVYAKAVQGDDVGLAVLRAIEEKNNALLRATGKDLDLLEGIYGAS
jgi:UDPglucose 6-dehydrogenase